jgi:hypothetical protein
MMSRGILQTCCWISLTLFLAFASCQTAVRLVTIAATFGHFRSPTWIYVTSLYGLAWKRSCSHENRPMNLRQEECSFSCAEGLRKTCITVCLWTYVFDFNKLLDEMVATSRTYWRKDIYAETWNKYMRVLAYKQDIHFYNKFPFVK